MKTTLLFLSLSFLIIIPLSSFGQEKPKLQYTVGFGSSIDGINSLWGVNFSNELNIKLGRRTSFNTGLQFYQSLGSYNEKTLPSESNGQNREQSSGIFITPTLKYDLIQRPSGFNLALAAGPSLQLGGETYIVPSFFEGSPPIYFTNKLQRIGLFTELEAEWNSKNPNRKNAAGISAYGTKDGLWYVNATYKLRFKLGKN